ncbi:MAG: hypothetical protein V4708_14770 [Bacteroidota bacterium]
MKFPFQKKKKKKKAAKIVPSEEYVTPRIALVVQKNADRLSNFKPRDFIGASLKEYAVGSNVGVQSLIKLLDPYSRRNLKANSIITIDILYALNPEIEFHLNSETNYLFETNPKWEASRQLHKLELGDRKIESLFTDEEAFAICGGIKKQHAFELNQKFFLKQSIIDLDILDAHNYAMTAYRRYGEEVLNYCLSLPPLPFHNLKILKAFQLLDRLDKQNPTIGLILPTTEGDKQYSISFRLKEVFNSEPSVIELKNLKTKEIVATISRDGTLIATNRENFYKGQLLGNTGETDHPKPEQIDHLKGWRRLPNFAGEDFQFSADLV